MHQKIHIKIVIILTKNNSKISIVFVFDHDLEFFDYRSNLSFPYLREVFMD
jgi:hypothetical protein